MSPPASGPAAIAVCIGARGGCGTSLLAGALALAWAAGGRRPLLIDLDLARGDLAPSWSVPADRSVADLAPVLHELTPAHLRGVAFPHASGVALVAAPASVPARWPAETAERLFSIAAAEWDAVAVDLGAGRDRPAAAAVAAARHVVAVCPPTLSGVRAARAIGRRLAGLGADGELRIVVGPLSARSELSARAFARAAGLPVAATLPRADAEARDLGGGRWSRGRRRRLTEAVARLAEELA